MVAVLGSISRSGQSRWFRDHLDGVTRALLEADRTAGAQPVVVAVPFAGTELDDRGFGAGRIAIVALEAIAAGETSLGLVERLLLGQAGDDLLEARHAHRR